MPPNFSWDNPYPPQRSAVFARQAIATSQPLATSAGLKMLQCGGNAVDAAIAAAAALTVTEPCSNGLGSDLFAQVWFDGKLSALNASGPAPATWTLDYFRHRYGESATANRPQRGWDTVTVPGAVAGWQALHQRFGRLDFEEVLAPAIQLGEEGFSLAAITRRKWANAVPVLQGQPGFAEHFLPGGRVPSVADHIIIPGIGRTLAHIARHGADTFYRGEIAQAIEAFSQRTGGSLTAADLAAYHPEWVDPVSAPFSGCMLHECPPNGQGIAAQICLGILGHTELAQLQPDSAAWWHLSIEAMKQAFADVYAHVTDPSSMRVSVGQLLDDTVLAQRAARIDRRRALTWGPVASARGGTVYLCTADDAGNMVSLIQSNYLGFGSGVVVPGWGISLQNRGLGFSLDATHPNVVAPGKRPFHTITPGFLSQDGQPRLAFGVMGGNMQPQGQVQTLCRMLIAGQNPQAACDAPRWKWNQGLEVEVESHAPADTIAMLRHLGHRVVVPPASEAEFGAGQFIWRLDDGPRYAAASDHRRDGHAAGI